MAVIIAVKDYNAAILQRIRVKCVEQNTSIPKIEKALGYGNGAISSWKNAKRVAPIERVQAVADYLHIPVESLVENISIDEQKEKPATVDGDGQVPSDFASTYQQLSPAAREELDRYAQYLLSRQDGK